MLRHIGFSAAIVLALTAFTSTGQAAPGSLGGAIEAGRSDVTNVEKVDFRRCWWRNGVKHCRWVREYGYGPYYGDGPYYGYGPSVGLYFGGGGHRGHGGHHRR